jgi:hypothetical protein
MPVLLLLPLLLLLLPKLATGASSPLIGGPRFALLSLLPAATAAAAVHIAAVGDLCTAATESAGLYRSGDALRRSEADINRCSVGLALRRKDCIYKQNSRHE